jgi:hypothetical protein
MILVVALVFLLTATVVICLFCAYRRGFTGFYSTDGEGPADKGFCFVNFKNILGNIHCHLADLQR